MIEIVKYHAKVGSSSLIFRHGHLVHLWWDQLIPITSLCHWNVIPSSLIVGVNQTSVVYVESSIYSVIHPLTLHVTGNPWAVGYIYP